MTKDTRKGFSILVEFEKRYNKTRDELGRGDVTQTEAICKEIAEFLGLDIDYVTDFVYTNRYQNENADLEEYLEEELDNIEEE